MYDFLVDILHAIWRNGLTLSSALAVLFVLLRQRRFKKHIKRIIPWLFQDESEVREYVQNQKRIESKLDLLLKERGLTWVADSSEAITKYSQTKKSRFYPLSWVVSITARFVARCTNYLMRGMIRLKQKLSSRKFWLAIVSAILVVLNEGMELGIDNNTVMAFASLVISWIIGESVVDAARASKAKGEKIDGIDYSASDNVSE